MRAWLDRDPEPWWQRLLLAPLWPASGLFGAGVALRHGLYRRGWLRVERAPMPVLSVGNLVAGGAGKTPVVLHLLRELISRGVKPAALSRGYGGAGRGARIVSRGEGLVAERDAADAGDEPVLLARRCPEAAVVVGPSRTQLARLASQLGARVAVLDDGFQHLALHRDADVVVLDAGAPLGNGHLLPRGPLREGFGALRRASAGWISKADEATPEAVEALAARIEQVTGRPAVRSRYAATGLLRADLAGPHALGLEALRGRPIAVLSGVARPASFERTLRALGAELVCGTQLPDHHAFRPGEVERLVARARASGAELLVMTEKDAVRLPSGLSREPSLAALRIEVELLAGAEVVASLLAPLVEAARGADAREVARG